MKPAYPANDNQIDRTLEVWQPRVARELSREEARQIAFNATSFFRILAEWSCADIAAANDNDAGASAGGAGDDEA